MQARAHALDWERTASELDQQGNAVLEGLLTAAECEAVTALYSREALFRSRVVEWLSVAMTNCGPIGWVSDRSGYFYSAEDPETGRAWPPLPSCFVRLAREAAAAAGFEGFLHDACLVNRYQAGVRLTLHQDKDERDLSAPIVSVSLGIPALFLLGGATRSQRPERIQLWHGDIVVWGGPSRLRYHGVLPLKEDHHPSFGRHRINLTFRKAG